MKKASMLTLATFFTFFTYAQSWNLVGNANATATSYLGTSNNFDLVFKRNAVIAGRMTDATTRNTSFGVSSLSVNTAGVYNTTMGYNAGLSNTTGSNNTSMGANSFVQNTTGNLNTAIGRGTMQYNTTGGFNTAIGSAAIGYNTLGNNNTAIGYWALLTNTTGSFNTALGYSANVSINNLENATAVGALSYVTQSNSLVLGSINGVNGALANTNIGIGTTAPSAQFHTTGTVKFGGLTLNAAPLRVVVSDIDGNIAYKDASTFGSIADGSETKVNAGANVTVSGTGTQASPYIITATVPTIPAAQWVASSIGTGNIVNTNAGAVVIGSTVATLPAGYKLYVADGILAEKVKVALKSGANWADYVFDKNYKLASLSQVESFIQKNKHLPGVPSAEELVKEGGIDMNQMFAKQMEKIEELTLHLIELNKKVEKLENENKALKTNK
jgi:trimeric autotransporter adhesin